MMIASTWWEEMFAGPLAIGINELKMQQLEDESFLYLKERDREIECAENQ